MRYGCEGCDKTFEGTAEEAFQAGWDTPERFMSHCTCDTCPITVTLWWRLMIEKRSQVTPEEFDLLQGYNQIYEAHASGSGE